MTAITMHNDPQTGSISLRKATLSDAQAISHLGGTIFTQTFGHSCKPEQMKAYVDESWSEDAMSKDISSPYKDVLVAVGENDPDKVLGFATLTRGSNEPCIYDVQNKIELQRLYVDSSAHGRGIGKKLMVAVEDMAREEGYEHMWLGVWEGNHHAQAVYKKQGYVRMGQHEFDIGGDIQIDPILLKKL